MQRHSVNSTTGCWEWTGNVLANGYGSLIYAGHRVYAHRASFQEFVGPIPDGMMVCHKCDNPRCINPEHLFVGTGSDNMRDCTNKGRNFRPGLGLLGTKSAQSVLADADVLAIRRLAKEGMPQRAIANQFGVSQSNIWYIIKRRTWPHLEDVA